MANDNLGRFRLCGIGQLRQAGATTSGAIADGHIRTFADRSPGEASPSSTAEPAGFAVTGDIAGTDAGRGEHARCSGCRRCATRRTARAARTTDAGGAAAHGPTTGPRGAARLLPIYRAAFALVARETVARSDRAMMLR
jgi:hypothetical protein